mmetsp:Transcript_18533/g.36920  ORF Transcript_18533/g.36920 Transcript_18533/m.36920 type:complete len:97 (+) Transcript_18533:498-788(+)
MESMEEKKSHATHVHIVSSIVSSMDSTPVYRRQTGAMKRSAARRALIFQVHPACNSLPSSHLLARLAVNNGTSRLFLPITRNINKDVKDRYLLLCG